MNDIRPPLPVPRRARPEQVRPGHVTFTHHLYSKPALAAPACRMVVVGARAGDGGGVHETCEVVGLMGWVEAYYKEAPRDDKQAAQRPPLKTLDARALETNGWRPDWQAPVADALIVSPSTGALTTAAQEFSGPDRGYAVVVAAWDRSEDEEKLRPVVDAVTRAVRAKLELPGE